MFQARGEELCGKAKSNDINYCDFMKKILGNTFVKLYLVFFTSCPAISLSLVLMTVSNAELVIRTAFGFSLHLKWNMVDRLSTNYFHF